MGRFEQIAKQVSQLPMDRQDLIADVIAKAFDADLNPKSLLSEAQNEELRLILAQPIEIATDAEMEEVFEKWGD
jgi:hypothetical protein